MATVLVVEDDKLSQRILSKMLAGGSHTALLAASVDEAWTVLRQNIEVDLVILDNQLGRDWGWQFLEGLREDVLYQEVPVVVYTGHTERNSILRYVELGVKSMLVKPYKAEIVFEEVNKAVKIDWTARLLESPQAACDRLKMRESDYYSLLSAGGSALEKNLADLRRLLAGRPDEAKLREILQQFYSQSGALGMPALRSVAETLARAIGARNPRLIENCLRGIDSLRALLRNRTLAYVGIENVASGTSEAGDGKTNSTAPGLSSASPKELFRQRTAGAAVWKFHREFARLTSAQIFPGDALDEVTSAFLTAPICVELLDTVRFLTGAAQSASVDDLVTEIRKSKALEKLFAQVSARSAGQIDTDLDTAEIDFEQLINRLGIHKTVLLLAAQRLDGSLRPTSLLDLSWMRKHTLVSLLLSYEIARMFNSDDDLLVSAAGAVHNLGSWCLAVTEPGLYAVALARAEGETTIDQAEASLFGKTHGAIGLQLLTEAGFSLTFARTASLAAGDLFTEPDDPLTLASVHLAVAFAWAVIAQDETHAQALRTRLLVPSHPVWVLLQETRTELPMDLPEFVETLTAAAQSCLSIVSSLKVK